MEEVEWATDDEEMPADTCPFNIDSIDAAAAANVPDKVPSVNEEELKKVVTESVRKMVDVVIDQMEKE